MKGILTTYRSKEEIVAICFTDTEKVTIDAIIDFAGLLVSVEYGTTGTQIRIVKGAYTVIIAKLGEYIYKREDGTLGACEESQLLIGFEKVTP